MARGVQEQGFRADTHGVPAPLQAARPSRRRHRASVAVAALIGATASFGVAAPAAASGPAPGVYSPRLWITIDRAGVTDAVFWMSAPPPRPAGLARALGQALGTPLAFRDEVPVPGPWGLGGRRARPLSRRGFVVAGELDLSPLLRELWTQQLGPLELHVRYPMPAFAQIGDWRERLPARAERTLLLEAGPGAEARGRIAVRFGFTPADLVAMALFPLAVFLVPVGLAWLARRAALSQPIDEPARVWFDYWRKAHWIMAGAWTAAGAALFAAQPFRLVSFLLAPRGWVPGMIGTVMAYLLAPATATVAMAALSHAVLRRVRGMGWTLRETVMQSVWHMSALLVPLGALLLGLAELLAGDRRLGAALLVAALAARVVLFQRYVAAMGMNLDAVTHGELRERIFALAQRAGVRLRQLYVVPMARSFMANAFAVRGHTVVLTDFLLAHLSRREVDAVLAHELTHLKRRHPLLLLALAVAVGATCVWIPGASGVGPSLVAVTLGTLVLFNLVSRRFERQADAGAVALTGDPEALISALARLSRLNCMPLDWSKWDEQLFTHPSTLRRARAIARRAGIGEARLSELLGPTPPARTAGYPTPGVADKVFSSAHKLRAAAGITWTLLALHVAVPAWVAGWGGWTGGGRWLWDAAAAVGLLVLSLAAVDGLAVSPYRELRRRLAAKLGRGEPASGTSGSVFVGLAPGSSPRVYENFYDWDLGFVGCAGERLRYVGEEARFTLTRDQVREIHVCAGAPGWIPSRRVLLRWQDPERGAAGCFMLRPADTRRLSHSAGEAARLRDALCVWWRAAAPPPEPERIEEPEELPPTGPVTGTSPRAAAGAHTLLPAAVLTGAAAAVACALLGAAFDPRAGMGFLDVWAVASVPQIFHRIPIWLNREP